MESKRLAADEVRRRLPPRARVLDAGTGVGELVTMLGPSMDVVALDLSAAALAAARMAGAKRLVRGTVEALPFPGESFDAVVSLDVLYHEAVGDERRALREAARVLRRRGLLILNLPAYRWMLSAHDAMARGSRRYTRSDVRALLGESDLVPVRLSYRNTILFPLAVVTRKVLRRSGSDVAPVHPALNRLLAGVLRLEARWLRRWSLPFGLAVFAVAERR